MNIRLSDFITLWMFSHFISGPSNRSNSVSSLDLEGESVSELGAGPSGSNGVEALQLLEHEQGMSKHLETTFM